MSRKKTGKRRRRKRKAAAAPRKWAIHTGPVPAVPNELVQAIIAGDCALYAGAGLSARLGLPTWSRFVLDLLEWSIGIGRIDPMFAGSLRSALKTNPALVADSIVSRFPEVGQSAESTAMAQPPPEGELVRYLRQVFLRTSRSLDTAHTLLKRIPFCAALTTNFDDLIERTFAALKPGVFTPGDAETLLGNLSRPDVFVLKLYGTLERPSSIILAPAQYRTAVAENRLFARFMESLFASKTLFFVGASLEGILDYLSGLNLGPRAARDHFALVDVSGRAWQVQAEALQRHYGIRVLPYSASAGWPELEAFLSDLSGKVTAAAKTTSASLNTAAPAPSALIRRVELTNIGPFDEVAFDFGPEWNLLLGDNGVGKSSVLRALAVGLCGLEARPYADRIIKSGRKSATITVVTERTRYVTQLYRTDSDAEMSVPPSAPLTVERWPAIGFPALRALTWNRAEEKTVAPDRATPADLIPLIKGEFDPRLDRLKGWLLDLDHQEAAATGSEKQRLRMQREKLFEMIQVLTPGLTLRFKTIIVPKHVVLVTTDDGDVPIEAVSQGTSSLLGWIGVLVQRLFDVYRDKPEPWNEPALVLIDEVDAHMHPQWQRMLAPSFQRLFPLVQVIGTTHSPLMIPSLNPNQVTVVRRENGKVLPERIGLDMRTFRADQVLTSRSFGLATTVGPSAEEDLNEYTRLAALERPTQSQRQQLGNLAERLRVRPASIDEREEARHAFEIIRESVESRVARMPADERRRIIDEVHVQLQESITGSRRLS